MIARRPVPVEVLKALGAQATDPNISFFAPLSEERFFDAFSILADRNDLTPEKLTPESDIKFALFTHQTVHGYFYGKHRFEFDNDIPEADPPPLPQAPFRKRITDYYANPAIQLRKTDKIHHAKLRGLHREYIPLADKYRLALPEIERTFGLRDRFRENGSHIAADVTNDVLAVYGQSLKSLILKAQNDRLRKAEAQERAKRIKQ